MTKETTLLEKTTKTIVRIMLLYNSKDGLKKST